MKSVESGKVESGNRLEEKRSQFNLLRVSLFPEVQPTQGGNLLLQI